MISLLVLLLFASVHAATPYVPVQPDPILETWRWRSYPELNGKGLRCLASDPQGKMWFGVADGVVVYDGVDWVSHPIHVDGQPVPVNHLLTPSTGFAHAATPRGVFKFSGGTWERVFPEADSPDDWFISALRETNDGVIWAATAMGALQLMGDRQMLFTSKDGARAVRVIAPSLEVSVIPDSLVTRVPWDQGNHYGIGVHLIEGNYIGLRRKGHRVAWAVAPAGPAASEGLRVGDVILAVDGRADVSQTGLFAQREDEVQLVVKRAAAVETLKVKRSPVAGHTGNPAVHDIVLSEDGSLWFAMRTGDVLRKHGDSWNRYTPEGIEYPSYMRISASDASVSAVLQSQPKRGVLTLDVESGTWREDVFHGTNFLKISLGRTQDGYLWIGGHQNHLAVHRHGQWSTYGEELPFPKTRVIDLEMVGDGVVWLAFVGDRAFRVDLAPSKWQTYSGLSFCLRARDGSDWFIDANDGVVRKRGAEWIRFNEADGLVSHPGTIVEDALGGLWVGGAHHGSAAVSQLRDGVWHRSVLSRLAQGVESRSGFASSSSVWFGGQPNFDKNAGHVGGVVEFSLDAPTSDAWTHHVPPDVIPYVYAITEAHGSTWIGGYNGLQRLTGVTWEALVEPVGLSEPSIDVLHTDSLGNLWVGHRRYGLYRYDGVTWKSYTSSDGLPDSRVQAITDDGRGNVWAAYATGYARFDGEVWQKDLLPPSFPLASQGALERLPDGTLWVSSSAQHAASRGSSNQSTLNSYSYLPDELPPDTRIRIAPAEVGYPGTAAILWAGIDAWHDTPADRLQYSWRMDDGPWSTFSTGAEQVFPTLESGRHVFEVRARDADFNVDPSPARVALRVTLPAWRQPSVWSILGVLLLAAAAQTLRLVRRDRALRVANQDLERRVSVRTQDLEDSERLLSVALEAVRMATWEWQVQKNVMTWSAYGDDLFSLPEGTLKREPFAFRNVLVGEDLSKCPQESDTPLPRRNRRPRHSHVGQSGYPTPCRSRSRRGLPLRRHSVSGGRHGRGHWCCT
jgi:ligand-binding sensor domain-containing protein